VVLVGNKWMLGGLTSFGRGCNDGGVYARTSNYYNWILQNLQQDQTLTTTTPGPNRKLKINENDFKNLFVFLNKTTKKVMVHCLLVVMTILTQCRSILILTILVNLILN
jgi:secreted trypsin-like serine protease